MSLSLQLVGDGGSVHLTVHGRERTEFEDVSDGNWLTVDASVKAAGCSAQASGAMTSSDFSMLARELSAVLMNEETNASLRTMEEWFELDAARKKSGTIVVSGKVQVYGTPGACLEFCFETDFGVLEQFARDVTQCSDKYPIIEI